MTKKTFTAAERQQIAAGWQTSGMSQPEYAALHDISDRTPREWVARHAAPDVPADAVRQVIRRTIDELERLLEGLGSGTGTSGEVPTSPSVRVPSDRDHPFRRIVITRSGVVIARSDAS